MENREPTLCLEHNRRRLPFSMKEEHYHPYNEIYYLIDGETKYFIAGEVYNIKKGDLAIIPAEILHKTMNLSGKYTECIKIFFSNDRISDSSILDCVYPRVIRDSDLKYFPIDALLREMEKEYTSGDKYSSIMLNSHLERFLICLCRTKPSSAQPSSNISASDRIILDAARYIDEHYGDELTLEGLAERFTMSPGHFSKKFKSVTGFGMSKYITQVRILNAEKLLLHTKLSVTEIAMRCGFSDSNYFTAVFKAHKGMPPHRYAKLHTLK